MLYGNEKSTNGPLIGYYVFSHHFMKSDDGGITWRYPHSDVRIVAEQVVVDPSGSGRVYAFGSQGAWSSEDRGETWSQIPGELGNAPLFDGYVRFGDVNWIYALARPQGDGSITKLDAAGTVVFSTLAGGRNSDKVQALAIAPNGDIVIGGTTQSDDLLSTAGALARAKGGFEQGFLARLSADGSTLGAFRYVGGGSTDSIQDLALLSSGEVAVVGNSASLDQPDVTPDALQPKLPAAYDGFLGVFSMDTFTPRYFSYLGSSAGGLSKLVTTGMKAYVLGWVSNPELGGAALSCEDISPPDCVSLLAEFDFTP